MALGVEGRRAVRGISDWSPVEVHEFLESILPGHPCLNRFTYTSGFVLDSLEKEDLQRQAQDDEAANVIWAQLQARRGCSAASAGEQGGKAAAPLVSPRSAATATRPIGAFQSSASRGLPQPGDDITVYVRTQGEKALELHVSAADSVASLKELIAQREGTPRESQRLMASGIAMQDDRSLAAYGLCHGASVLLVPQLGRWGNAVPKTSAPRGLLTVPGSHAWRPKGGESRPMLPVVYSDVSRPFPVSLAFDSVADLQAFTAAAPHGEAPVLEIPQPASGRPPVEIRLHLDAEEGAVHLGSSCNDLDPSTEYEAFIHFGGRGGHTKVLLTTGATTVA